MKNKKVITKNLEVDELYRMSTTRALKNVSLKRYLRLKFQDNTMSWFSRSRIPWDWVGIFAKSIPWVWLRIFVNSTQGFWLQIWNNFYTSLLQGNFPPGCKVFSTCIARSFHSYYPKKNCPQSPQLYRGHTKNAQGCLVLEILAFENQSKREQSTILPEYSEN